MRYCCLCHLPIKPGEPLYATNVPAHRDCALEEITGRPSPPPISGARGLFQVASSRSLPMPSAREQIAAGIEYIRKRYDIEYPMTTAAGQAARASHRRVTQGGQL